MKRGLYEYKIVGVKNNIGFLRRIINSSQFIEGKYNTNYITDNIDFLLNPYQSTKQITEDIAIIATYFDYLMSQEDISTHKHNEQRAINRWKEFGKHKGVLRI
jgi:acetyl-CoA carboxylase biotin carboxylase subunit